jgi:hypothetical protein
MRTAETAEEKSDSTTIVGREELCVRVVSLVRREDAIMENMFSARSVP